MIFRLSSTIPDKDFVKSEPRSLNFVENLTRIPLKLENPENCGF